jgi:prefoldin subunit 5
MTRYSPEFFATQSIRSLLSARVVLGALFEVFRPRSVIDVGCGVGPWLRAAQELGTEDLLGVDGEYVVRGQLLVDPDRFVAVDLERQRLAEVLRPRRRFDLVMCMEVAEHLSFDRAPTLVEDLASVGDVVLFSAAIPFQGGEHHVNEQWPEFWGLLFRQAGFACADFLRSRVWARPDVDWWYAQNTLLFVRQGSESGAALSVHQVPPGLSLSRVHPNNYLDQIHKWFHTFRFRAAAEENTDFRNLLDAYVSGGAELPGLQAIARARSHSGQGAVFPFTRSERFVPEQAIAELRARIAELQREIEIHQHAIPALEAARRDFQRARTTLEIENADLRTQRKVLDAAHDGLREAITELRARIAELQREIEIHQHAVPALEAARRDFERARTTLETENADLRTQQEVLDAAHDGLRAAYRALQSEHYDLQSKHDDLQAKNISLQTEHDRTRSRLRDLEERLVELQQLVQTQPPAPVEAQHSRAMRVAEFYYSRRFQC